MASFDDRRADHRGQSPSDVRAVKDVIPAKAGTSQNDALPNIWVPAFAGMTPPPKKRERPQANLIIIMQIMNWPHAAIPVMR